MAKRKVEKSLKNSLWNRKLFPVGRMMTGQKNNFVYVENPQEARVNRRSVAVYALFFGILLWSIALKGIAQEPYVRFIDVDGKIIAEVPAQLKDEKVYLSVDAVKQVFDPAMTDQYNYPRKRLTLRTKNKQIRLQMGKPTVTIDPGGKIVTLSTPPMIIAQQPMVPVTFFTQLLPIFNDVEVIYNPSLRRVQMRPKGALIPTGVADSQNWAIIIDPGHGGADDRGCEGNTGLLEKDVILALAKQIQQISKQKEMQVYLTRRRDTKKTHFERIQVANRNQGKLFLSLHCNASFSPHEKGVKIYLNNPKGELRFPRMVGQAPAGQRLKILAQANFLKQSRDFAFALQAELNFLTEIPVTITEMPLVTLSEIYMPAVVLELGYLSNVEDLEKLSNPEYIASVAQAVTRAIQRYVSSVNQSAPATVSEQ
ncbi:MAG: N-acetylmuramoyl-L-alanine amidase [Candidatus Poribacteria bacterium]|nr:N-acetylmuramoyl-L-alanine amidase [Candidatus Poribacteria bacterium]